MLRELARKIRQRGSSELSAIDWLLVILCPGIGCIVGIVAVIRGDARGGKMIGLSFLFSFLWAIIRFMAAARMGP